MPYPTEGYVSTEDGSRLWYAVAGNPQGKGVPIVCANGIGCSIYFWKYISQYFGQEGPVLIWDYRGHGKSDIPADRRVTVRQCADDMRRVMDAAGLDKAVFIGHSMGSQVILEFYRLYAERVAGLVPLLGAYGKPLDTFFDSVWPRRIFPWVYRAATAVPQFLSRVTELTVNPEVFFFAGHKLGIINGYMANRDDMRDYFYHIARVPVDIFFHLADDAGRHTCGDILENIEVPTLIIGGERDKFTPVWLSEEMRSRIPGAELMIIKEGSHAAIIEQPQLINLRLEKFIRELVASRAAAKSAGAPTKRRGRTKSPA